MRSVRVLRACCARAGLSMAAAGALTVCGMFGAWAQTFGAPATSATPATPDPAVRLSRFDQTLEPFTEIRLSDKLKPNRWERQRWEGVDALVVLSQGSMSLMARTLDLDFTRTPILCWRWRIDAPLQAADMATKAGDDYAARLYLSLRLPDEDKSLVLRAQLRIARTLWGPHVPDAALNYVWDNRQAIGTERPNAYTERTRMIVQRTGATDSGRWVSERRNVAADAQRLFGARAQPAQLALTADTDNTGESARAGFAQVHAVALDEPCRFD